MKKILTIIALLAVASSAYGADGKDVSKRERAMQRRMQQQMQQVAAEKDALAQENAALKAKIAELNEAAVSAERKADRLAKDKRQLEAVINTDKTEHASVLQACRQEGQTALQSAEALQAKLSESEQKFAQERAGLVQAQAEKKNLLSEKFALQRSFDQQDKQLTACHDKNQKMYGVTREVIDRQRNDALFAREPLFGLGKVEIENLFQEYEDRAYAEKLPVPAK